MHVLLEQHDTPFAQAWELSRKEHEELTQSGFLHVTGHSRFPKLQNQNAGKYAKMLSGESCFFVVSSQGLIFIGFNLQMIKKKNYELVPVESIQGFRVSRSQRGISFTDIKNRKSNPLFIFPSVKGLLVKKPNQKNPHKKRRVQVA